MANKALLVFDIDGSLVNTEKSYLEAIRHTVEHFTSKQISQAKVSDIKMLSGFNNDWYATYALINSELTGNSIEKYISINKDLEKISFEEVKEVFQNLYLGDDLYQKFEKKTPSLNIRLGLWEKETLIFNKKQLSGLAKKYGNFKIITGRTHLEATHIINHFKIQEFFDQIISVEDICDGWFAKHDNLKPYGKDKANPITFYQIQNIETFNKIFYIGDSISDMELVFNAKDLLPVKGVHFLECFSDDKKIEIMIKTQKYKPTVTFDSAKDVCGYFLK